MNEMTMNNTCMYDEVEEIRNLNKVEGFDPRKYMRLIPNEGQAAKYYLDVAYRKLWFRLRYPEGKIVKKILKLTEQVAIVEARVYLNRNDDEDNFISNALAQKYMTADGQFGNKFVELAETAAVGRALSDAGFGLQFADREGDIDPEVTEAPFDPQMIVGMGGTLPEGTYMDSTLQEDTAGEGEILQEETFPGQYGIEEYIPMPEDVGQAMGMTPAMQQTGVAPAAAGKAEQGTVPAAAQGRQVQQPAQAQQPQQAQRPTQAQQPVQGMTPAMQNNQAAQTLAQEGTAAQNASRQVAQKAGNTAGRNAASTKGGSAQAAGGIRRDMPVEQIYSMLNRDSAAAVVIPMGFNKGKTLGQVAVEKPANLQWYVDSYGGP
ncbi:MAG: hypothetical protein K2N43_07965, partial [Lachnospiraceae bacterium]|nr:hypothetical protein [Lachnospiraceae bacterium]